MFDLNKLMTESRNDKSQHLDDMSIATILKLMNTEDQTVPQNVAKALPQIQAAVEKIVHSFQHQGRLFYIGAGTSGRLGVLDAAECVPTFGTDPELVQGLIAGGMPAMTTAVEGAEDDQNLAATALKTRQLTPQDTVVGIAASGRTPYVLGGLDYATQIGASTISLACNQGACISQHAQIAIEVPVGPEVLTGSTRLKSGTAQKLVLNMLSTTAMIKIGKVYQNLMVDVRPTNAKLIERAKQIIMAATDCDYATAERFFSASDQNVKLAIVMLLTDLTKTEAQARLNKAQGFVGKSLEK
ncbi:MAG: N-acetylmuramic acid 6-phosphate etherase [Lactobacillus sp.]|jgi:N-acetylmuramic acid 6-phosphate etherase|nr:N-acetylmuramic acid 6-phosphate etherase [Lactobacillus sp.]